MTPEELLVTPPATHFVYIPFILFLGGIVGFIIGRRVGIRAGEAEYLAGFDDDDDLLTD